MDNRIFKSGIVTLLLIVMGVAALYAYSQKQPSADTVPFDTAITEIGLGRVRTVEVMQGRNTALLTLRDGTRQQIVVGDQGGRLLSTVREYNAANPDRPTEYVFSQDPAASDWLGQLLIAIVPIVLIAGLFWYMMRRQPRGVVVRAAIQRTVAAAGAPKAIGPYSQAITSGNLVFCSGLVALDPGTGELVAGDIREQTRRTISNLEAVLRASGSDLQHVVKTTVFLADMNDFQLMNAAYAEAFGDHAPARSTVEVGKLPRGARVEIECVAIRAS